VTSKKQWDRLRRQQIVCKCGQVARLQSYGILLCVCGRWYEQNKKYQWEHRAHSGQPLAPPQDVRDTRNLAVESHPPFPMVHWSGNI